jgi:hypothetical protein
MRVAVLSCTIQPCFKIRVSAYKHFRKPPQSQQFLICYPYFLLQNTLCFYFTSPWCRILCGLPGLCRCGTTRPPGGDIGLRWFLAIIHGGRLGKGSSGGDNGRQREAGRTGQSGHVHVISYRGEKLYKVHAVSAKYPRTFLGTLLAIW